MDRVKRKNWILLALIVFGTFSLLGCGAENSSQANSSQATRLAVAPLWETAKVPGSAAWSTMGYSIVENLAPHLIQGSSDVANFCPNYFNLQKNQKISFWVYLVSAIVRYESYYDPTSRYVETGMGIDPITGQTVVSEGLLQLSYQDVRAYPFCNEFDWSQDRLLAPNNPSKSILDPEKNLRCGIQILNELVRRENLIAFSAGNYWSTLKPGGQYSKVTQMQARTNQILFCKN